MTALWLWGEQPFLHWLVQVVLQSIVGFALFVIILTPLYTIVKNGLVDWLDPHTQGGIGDIPDAKGVKAWERLAQKEKQ